MRLVPGMARSGFLLSPVIGDCFSFASLASTNGLGDLAEKCKELMLVLKPERAVVVEQRFGVFSQGLVNFREILFQNSAEPLANSRLAFEQLRGAVLGGSEFLLLVKEVRDSPSALVGEVLRLREALEGGGRVVTVEAPESVRPMLERLARDIEALRGALAGLERALVDVKERVRVLQDDSVRFGDGGERAVSVAKKDAVKEEKSGESGKGQLSLSQFKN